MDKLAAMQAFVRVVEAGTFTRAADSMQLPKATVTRLVQTLESHLQTKLLNRTTRRVTVTADGAAYFDRATRLLGELDELESGMTRAKVSPRGRLRIDVPASLGQLLLIPNLPEFHARYPEIQIDLGVSDRPVDLMSENVDCVLRGGEITDQNLVARRIGEFHLILCAAPSYLQKYGAPRAPQDLEGERHQMVNYLSHRTGRPYSLTLEKGSEKVEVNARHVLAVNDSTAGLLAGLAGIGITYTATFQAYPHIKSGALVPVLLDWCAETIPLYVVYPPNRHLSNKVRVFVDWVVELFAREEIIGSRCCMPSAPCQATQAGPAIAETPAAVPIELTAALAVAPMQPAAAS
jgi:LysR family transcriptional regulator, regulator for bpeEF and oprC